MPKTKDAFAFRSLYKELYSVCEAEAVPTYNERVDKYYCDDEIAENNYLNSLDYSIEEILLCYLHDGKIKTIPDYSFNEKFPETKKAKELLALDKERILKVRETKKKIEHHLFSLQKYSQKIFNEILSNGLSNCFEKKGRRVKHLIGQYEYLSRLFLDYEVILSQDWKMHDQVFQQECRKEFGNRLRQARLEKNLTTSDLAKQIGLSRVGYGYYELGQRDLPTPTIYRLAEILEVSIDWLFGLKK